MSEFRTQNLGLAAFLAHIGIPHLRTELVRDKGCFVFADLIGDECDRIKRDYFSGAGCEDAQRLCEMVSTIKGTIRIAQHDGVWKNPEI